MITDLTITVRDETEEASVDIGNKLIVTGQTEDGATHLDWNVYFRPAIQYISEMLLDFDQILRGESRQILETHLSKAIWLEAPDSETDHHTLSLRDHRNITDPEGQLVKSPVPVSLDALACAVLDFGAEMLAAYERVYPDSPPRQVKVAAPLENAQRQYEYYREHGTLDGYEPVISREHFETYLQFGHTDERLDDIVVRTDIVSSFVEHLHECPEEYDLFDHYTQLLTHEEFEVRRRAFETLLEQDAPNAPASAGFIAYLTIKESTESACEEQAIRLLPRLEYDSDDLVNFVEQYCEILAESDPDLVRAVIEALDGIEPGELEDWDRRDLVEALENAAEEADDGEMQRDLKTLVDRFDD